MLNVLQFSVLRQLVSDLQSSLDVVSRIPYRSISTIFPRHGEAAQEVAVGVAASAGRPDGLEEFDREGGGEGRAVLIAGEEVHTMDQLNVGDTAIRDGGRRGVWVFFGRRTDWVVTSRQ